MRPDRIVLVYNADRGLFNSVIGWSHKLLSPATYECSLCRHTFGLSGMLVPWKTFLSMLPFPSEFLHRDEFRTRYPKWANHALPLIVVESRGESEVLISASEINESGGLSGLIALVEARLDEWSEARAGEIGGEALTRRGNKTSPAHVSEG